MEDLGLTSDKVTKQDPETRLFRRRWIIIFAFALYLSTNAYQWLHIIIISDVILIYYNASLQENEFSRNSTVDWLSLVYMLTFVVLIIPSMWLLERKGLRFIALSGSFCNAAGAMIKVASVSEERFGVLMFGQTVCGIAQALTLSLPTKIAAVWFGQNEVSTATAIGVFGTQIGHALGFVVPPVLVPASINHSDIGTNLRMMFYIGAGVTTFCFILLIVVFRKEPSVPPSKAQIASKVLGKQRANYLKSLVNLGKIRDFYLLCLAFAINLGCSYAISTLLNPMILYYFEGHQKDAGIIGLTMILSGTIGSVVSGIWLDRTKMFKGTTIGIYLITVVGMVVYSFILKMHLLWVVYLCAGFLGFFLTGGRPAGFQFAVEVTYPESEGISTGILNGFPRLLV